MASHIGAKVILKFTKERGVVVDYLGTDMVIVRTQDGHEIPCFLDDCLSEHAFSIWEKEQQKEQSIQKEIKQPKVINSQYAILKSIGIQLAFEPILNKHGMISHFDTYLINDFTFNVVFGLGVYLGEEVIFENEGTIASNTAILIGEMPFDDLNENPEVEAELQRISTAGDEPKIIQSLKIKPQQFFQKNKMSPIINRKAHLYLLAENLEEAAKETKEDDLFTYSKKIIKNSKRINSTQSYQAPKSIIQEYAEFDSEIDLHIEKLTADHSRLTKSEILQIQLTALDKFIWNALRLGVDKVYVIHGVGKGSLKDAVHRHLKHNSSVAFVKNEYFKKYGYGASEVNFY